jgi:hypothetical protein
MEELLTVGANMNVSLLAVLPGEGREPKAARAEGVPVPQHSGFIASLVCGDYVFVAGQMPNNEAMTGLDPKAYRPPNAVWNGTDIRLQTEFLITSRLKSGLEAGGSSIKNAIKAHRRCGLVLLRCKLATCCAFPHCMRPTTKAPCLPHKLH